MKLKCTNDEELTIQGFTLNIHRWIELKKNGSSTTSMGELGAVVSSAST